jgi:hypothetical protein
MMPCLPAVKKSMEVLPKCVFDGVHWAVQYWEWHARLQPQRRVRQTLLVLWRVPPSPLLCQTHTQYGSHTPYLGLLSAQQARSWRAGLGASLHTG